MDPCCCWDSVYLCCSFMRDTDTLCLTLARCMVVKVSRTVLHRESFADFYANSFHNTFLRLVDAETLSSENHRVYVAPEVYLSGFAGIHGCHTTSSRTRLSFLDYDRPRKVNFEPSNLNASGLSSAYEIALNARLVVFIQSLYLSKTN